MTDVVCLLHSLTADVDGGILLHIQKVVGIPLRLAICWKTDSTTRFSRCLIIQADEHYVFTVHFIGSRQ